jgi:hypothetical protein
MAVRHALALRAVLVVTALSVAAGTGAAADATWKTHQDDNCGLELKYPGTYSLETTRAADVCAFWIRIGLKQARGLVFCSASRPGRWRAPSGHRSRPRTSRFS